ncbi:type II secretion system secretin GspD [Hyphococcus formosus]|uniref:type II secretion system secretin GspD n=1 Tax=Hyphococcus formosus TaxID=3143534 RepID=UPI00398B8C28
MVKLARAIPAVLVAAIGAVTPLSAMAQENCGAALNYEDADIRAVVDEIAIRTGRTFLLDPAVQGRVTVKSPPNGRLCADEAWELFQAVLRVNDFAATPAGDGKYRIVPLQEAARAAGPVGEGRGSDLTTQIIRLNYVDAREAAANLAQIIGNNGVVSPVRTGNSIIVVDTADNVARITEVLKKLDQDTTIYRTIPLQHSSAVELSRLVSELASEMNEESGARGSFSVVPVEASNSLLIRAEPSLMRRLELVVSELDQFGGATSNLSVVYLKHADAEEMAPLLTEVVNSTSASGLDGAPGRTRASVSYHKPTNSLIINGDAEIQRTLQNVITQLDVRRAQVLVEAIIVDVSDTTVRDLGLQYFLTGTEGSRVPFSTTNFSSAQPNILAAAGAALLESDVVGGDLSDQKSALTEAAVNSLLGFNGFALGGAGQLGENSFFGAILTAIQDDSFSNVLSTPSIMTLDNETARLQVGQEIPVTTGEAVGDNLTNAFRTVSRQEVGVILEVTPQVNEGGTVTLKIVQEISSVAGPILSTSTDLITNKREISTTALVDDGDILVIGGLIDDTREDKESKVPYLGDIPALGNLFKSTSRERRRQNLMVFIRPSIIRDQSSANLATGRKMDYMRARELLRDGTPISGMEKLIDEVTGTKAPQ